MESKKSLGQNFFINRNLCEQIVDIVLKNNPDIVVEIGPGGGSFTSFFYKSNTNMILVEKDDVLANTLGIQYPKIQVENSDFLDYDLNELEAYKGKKILFFGSLPYNVSKLIIRKIITSKYFQSKSYFIIQKEVAEKYISKEPDNNLLSATTALYAYTKKIFDISPESFKPKPKVHSSFISFSPKKDFQKYQTEEFKHFLTLSFKQPRKTLKNNLRNFHFKDNKNIKLLLRKRAQHLSLKEYTFLFSNIK